MIVSMINNAATRTNFPAVRAVMPKDTLVSMGLCYLAKLVVPYLNGDAIRNSGRNKHVRFNLPLTRGITMLYENLHLYIAIHAEGYMKRLTLSRFDHKCVSLTKLNYKMF